MATNLAGYTERERAALKECRKNTILGGLKWGLPSLLPLWAAFRARLLPPFIAPATYTVSFVLFSFLGAMSQNNNCIDSILDMEDSELAEKLRKKLPRQARLYDKRKALTSNDLGSGARTTMGQQLESPQRQQGRDKYGGVDDRERSALSGEWMQRQNDKRAIRRNKYGDIVFDDDVK